MIDPESLSAEFEKMSGHLKKPKKVINLKDVNNKTLWRMYADAREKGDGERVAIIRNAIYERFKADVIRVAKSYHRKLPTYSAVNVEDSIAAALGEHLKRIDKFDHTFGTSYMQYVNANGKSCIQGAVIDQLRRMQDLPRDIAAIRRELRPMYKELSQKLGKVRPTIEEFCDEYGMEWESVLRDLLVECHTFSQSSSDNEDDDLIRSKPCGRRNLWKRNQKAERNLVKFLDSVTKDDRIGFVVWAYHFAGLNNEEIAETIGRSVSTVSTLRTQGEQALRVHLTRQQLEGLLSG